MLTKDDFIKLQENQKEQIIDALFKDWCNTEAEHVDLRESLHAEYRAFKKLTFRTTRSINGGRDV